MLRRLLLVFATALLLGATHTGTVSAATPPTNRGLLITPIRQFLTADAGKSVKDTFVIANLTETDITVNFTVQQFGVNDFDYAYNFKVPRPNWITLDKSSVTLKSGQSQTIGYSLKVPSDATPGGRYYTLLASAKLNTQGIDNTIQAANMLYITVNGALRKTSSLNDSSIARFSFGKDIPYTLQPKNTGNVHFFAYVTGQLHGLSVEPAPVATAHVLLPNTIRTINDSIPSPVLPGIYRATFGYKTDAGQTEMVSRYIVFIPPWSIAFLLALLLLGGGIVRKKRRSTNSVESTKQPTE